MSFETELLSLQNRLDGPKFRVIEDSHGAIQIYAGNSSVVTAESNPLTGGIGLSAGGQVVSGQPAGTEILIASLTGVTTEQGIAKIAVPAGSVVAGGLYELRLVVNQPTGSGGNKTVRVRLGGSTATEAATTITIASSTNQSVNATMTMVIGATLDDVTVHAIATGMTSTGAPVEPVVDFSSDVNIWVTGQLANAADAINLLACKLIRVA